MMEGWQDGEMEGWKEARMEEWWDIKVREIVGHGGKRSLMDGAAAHIACATCSAGRFESLERAHVHAAAAQGLGAGAEA